MAQTRKYGDRMVVITGSDTVSGTPELVFPFTTQPEFSQLDRVKIVRWVIEGADGATSRVVKITQEMDDGAGTLSDVEIFNRTVNATDQYILDRNAGGFASWAKNPKVSTAANNGDVTVQLIYE